MCVGIETPVTTDKLATAIEQLKNAEQNVRDIPVLDWNDITDQLIDVYRGI